MIKIKIHTNQSIFDIALLYYGGIEGIWNIIDDNNLQDGINANLNAGDYLIIDENKILNEKVANYLKIKGIATDI